MVFFYFRTKRRVNYIGNVMVFGELLCRYEMLAIQQAEIKRMAMEESKTSETKGVYEVEMSETKQRLSTEHATP